MTYDILNDKINYPNQILIETFTQNEEKTYLPTSINNFSDSYQNYINESYNDDNIRNDTSDKTSLNKKRKREENIISNEKPEKDKDKLNSDYEHFNKPINPNVFSNITHNIQENFNNIIDNIIEGNEESLIDIKKDEGEKIEKEGKIQKGRKTNEDKRKGNNGLHTKESEDNIITKIKTFFGKSLYQFIKSSFINKEDFLKIDSYVNICISKDYNEKLFKKQLKDLYRETKISDLYRLKDLSTNEKIINKVYEGKKEKAIMKILDLTYIEAFNIFRNNISKELEKKIEGTKFLDDKKFNNIKVFYNKIVQEEQKKGETMGDIKQYLIKVNTLVYNFEKWFADKEGRK